MELRSYSEKDTNAIARRFAAGLKGSEVVLLQGELGTGKSVFAREVIRTLCEEPEMEVPSPTFTLVQLYESKRGTIWHFDLYRLEDSEEVYELGWEEALSEGIVLLEWPERLGGLKSAGAISVQFKPVQDEPDSRLIRIEGNERKS